MGQDAAYPRLSSVERGTLRLLVFVGTRPEAVKLAPLVLAGRAHRDVDVRLVSSGQHPKPMLEVLSRFGLGVDGDVELFASGQTLEELTGGGLRGFAAELARTRPDVVVVQGDTTTAFAGALASFYAQVPVAHVEAGLRTHDRYGPFPEEMNRRLIDALATFLFPPTDVAAANLAAEGIPLASTFTTGNTIVDALQLLLGAGPASLAGDAAGFDDPRWRGRVLVTAHRRESWGGPMDEIAAAVARIGARFPEHVFLLPLHPNPIVRRSFAGVPLPPNVLVADPLPYAQFVGALARADLVVTDSGGAVEEATALGRPSLILRERTERPEAVAAGAARVAGVTRDRIEAELDDALQTQRHAVPSGVFGDGRASERTIAWLRWRFGLAAVPPEPFVFVREELPV